MASLHYTKEASVWAQQLLAICNDRSDVLLATAYVRDKDKSRARQLLTSLRRSFPAILYFRGRSVVCKARI